MILNNKETTNSSKLTISNMNTTRNEITKIDSDKLLRNKRSKKYIDALSKLDSGDVCIDKSLKEELLSIIREEFEQIEMTLWPIGIISKCYLGDNYEVHTLNISLQIIEHFKTNEKLPYGMDVARNIASNKNYAFVEVYNNYLRVVNNEGIVSEIKI